MLNEHFIFNCIEVKPVRSYVCQNCENELISAKHGSTAGRQQSSRMKNGLTTARFRKDQEKDVFTGQLLKWKEDGVVGNITKVIFQGVVGSVEFPLNEP